MHLAREDVPEVRMALVRILPPLLAEDLRFARPLWAEAPAARAFRHPRAARLIAVERDAAETYVATELVCGVPFSEFLRRNTVEGRPLPHAHIAWVGAQVARALSAAHAVPWFDGAPAPIVHGAVNPRQVIIEWDGAPRLVGLGLGRARHAAPIPLSRLPYAAPELVRAQALTVYADAYGLGATLHAALTGRAAYRRPDREQTLRSVLEQNAAPLAPHRLEIDPEAGERVAAMMAPRPDARPGDLGVVADWLERVADGIGEAHQAALAERMASLFAAEREVQERQVEATRRLREEPSSVIIEKPPAKGSSMRDGEASRPNAPGEDPSGSAPSEHSTNSDGSPPDPTSERSPKRSPEGLAPGMKVGRYRVEEVKAGWHVIVCARARDPNVGRFVDLEVFDPTRRLAREEPRAAWAELFKDSARCAAQLAHPGLPILLDTGRDARGQLFATYLPTTAQPLAQELQAGRTFSVAQTRAILIDVAQALGVLAQKGYVHGAVGPRSVGLNADGRAVILHVRTATHPGPGHPALAAERDCASPEFIRGEGLGFASDQFSAGVLAYRLLAGRHPFEFGPLRLADGSPSPANGLPSLLEAQSLEPPTEDAALSQVVLRLLQSRPEERFGGWAEVGASLRIAYIPDPPGFPSLDEGESLADVVSP